MLHCQNTHPIYLFKTYGARFLPDVNFLRKFSTSNTNQSTTEIQKTENPEFNPLTVDDFKTLISPINKYFNMKKLGKFIKFNDSKISKLLVYLVDQIGKIEVFSNFLKKLSLALVLLLKEWTKENNCQLYTFTVNHKLRPESKEEAKKIHSQLTALGK